jgi:molybdopterin molybdotransferase
MSDASAVTQPGRKPLMPLDDALAALLATAVATVQTETVPLSKADGRVLAVDVCADLDVPGFDNSSMDGYAVSTVSLQADPTGAFPVSQRIPAGHFGSPLAADTVARIFTGAPVPPTADAVVMQEACEILPDGRVRIQTLPSAGQNVRRRGEDVRKGDIVVARGTRLGPDHIGLLASIGNASVTVYRRLRVALMSTGDELIQPGTIAPAALPPGAIYSSNAFFLSALLQRLGCDVTDFGNLPDQFEATKAAFLKAAVSHDLVLTSGGVSVGEEDHVKPAVQALGRLDLWSIAIKPGKPFAHGHIAHAEGGAHFIGLPGNPVSSFVTFLVLVRPFIQKLSGQVAAGAVGEDALQLQADFDWPTPDKRREFLRVKRTAEGHLALFNNQSSGVLTSVAWADGLVDNPPGQAISKGDVVRFLPLAALLS